MSSDHNMKILHVLDGFRLSYHYSLVDIYTPQDLEVDFSNLKYGLLSSLVPEPENQYDQKAIAVYISDNKVGYLYRNRLQSMAHDYIGASLPIYSYIDSVDTESRKITIFLAFYGTTFAPNKFYKLSGSRSKAAQEAIGSASEGETAIVTYNDEKQRYNVFITDYLIGYLPQPAENYARDYNCIIHSIETDDNDKYVVYVRFEKPSSEKTSAPTLPPMSAPTPKPVQHPPHPAPAPQPAPPPPKPAPAANFAPPPPKPAPAANFAPPPPKSVPAAKPDPVIQRSERALAASPSVSPHRPVSPHEQRTVDLFRTLYPDSKVTSFHQMRGEGNYFSIHTSQDGQEKRFIVQYDSDSDAIDCYDTRMNPLSTTRAKKPKAKRSHAFWWALAVAAVVLAVLYFLR